MCSKVTLLRLFKVVALGLAIAGCTRAPDSTFDVPFARMSVEVWEVTRRANADVVVGAMDLSKADGWRKADESVAAAATKDAEGPFLRLGGGKHLGLSTAVGLPDLVPVREGETYTLAFEARANGGEDIAMFYLRTFDCDRRDVTGPIVVPHGWAFTPYSKAYWENGFHFSSTGRWQRFSKTVSVPLGVRYLQPMVAMWRGQKMDVRNLRVTLHRPTEERRVDPAEIGLKLDVACEGDAEKGTLVRATVRDLTPRPRALKLVLNAARDLAGWTYHDNWRVSKTIEGDGTYGFEALVSGHPVSRYPFTAVSKDGAGFAIGTPFDAPVFESRTVTTNGIRSTYVLGLLPRADGRHGGRPSQDGELFGTTATVEWLVLPFKGNWGFRSAARAYYAREAHKIPDLWKGRREGTWLWPIFPSKLPKDPDDFGLTLWEAPSGIGRNPREIEAAHKLGIEVYPYTEAWGLRQEIKTGADGRMTTVEERIAELERWAAETNTTERWRGVPRNVAARACLSSLPVSPDGTHPFSVDKYGVLSHWWMTNADPRLREKPNRHSICWDEAKVGLDLADGIYLDSVTAIHSSYVNVRPEHLAVMDENLIYDPETAVPCASGMHHQTAFIKWLAAELHPKGKRIFGNAFRIAQRFHATTADIFGGEVGGWGGANGEARQHRAEPDDAACEKRFYAYHRPVANLLQEGCFWAKAPELSAKGVENYVEHHLFYGFFPGITTIGGDKVVDYAKWMRYFGPTRQCERDRAVFKKAIPLLRKLHAAGWEPETFLRSSLDHVWVERYGSTKGGKPCYFTLRNDSDKPCEVELALEPNAEVKFSALRSLWKHPSPVKTAAGWRMRLEPWATAVLETDLEKEPLSAPAVRLELRVGETVSGLRDRVRALPRNVREKGVEVVVPPGRYAFVESLVLDERDSGLPGAPVVWRAKDPSDKPVFVSGVEIKKGDFKPLDDPALVARLDASARGKVLEADLSAFGFTMPISPSVDWEVWGPMKVPDVFVNGRRVPLANYPMEGWCEIEKIIDCGTVTGEFSIRKAREMGLIGTNEVVRGGTFRYREDRPSVWKNPVLIECFWAFDWRATIIWTKTIDAAAKTMTMKNHHQYGIKQGNPRPRRWRALNVFEELNAPGRYAIDPTKKKLYLYPPDEPWQSASVCGKPGGTVKFAGAHDIVFSGIDFGASWGYGAELVGAKRVTIEKALFRDQRDWAVFGTNVWDCTLRTCDVTQVGDGCFCIWGGDRRKLVPGNNLVENCLFEDWGTLRSTCGRAIMFYGVGNNALHNEIRNANGYVVSYKQNDGLFAYNVVSNTTWGVDDAGAFYKGLNPSMRGNRLEYNYWRDIGKPGGHGSCAIYFDDGDSGDSVYGNVFENCGKFQFHYCNFGAVFSHAGCSNIVRNCLFVKCDRSLGGGPWKQEKWEAAIKGRNPVKLKNYDYKFLEEVDCRSPEWRARYPELETFLDPYPAKIRMNAAYDCVAIDCPEKLHFPQPNGAVYHKGGYVEGHWYTNGTFVAVKGDPGFVDYAKRDYRLKPNSEIYRRLPNFKPIPFEKIGLLNEDR